MNRPSVAEICETFSYNPKTGELRWKLTLSNRAQAGAVAGSPEKDGRRKVGFHNKDYFVNVLAWVIMMRRWPEHQVDHKNGDPKDDRWRNLRAATPQQNMANSRRPSHNTSGYKGVCFDKTRQKWMAYITINGRFRFLGYFPTAQEAAEAYRVAATEAFGEFARFA